MILLKNMKGLILFLTNNSFILYWGMYRKRAFKKLFRLKANIDLSF